MKFYITTPIYYLNDEPHIGHAYTTIAADIMARWKKIRGFDVFFLTGSDEHGAKIAAAAKEKGKTPQEFTDEMSGKFKEIWKLLNISYSDFIRTTEERHIKSVQTIIQTLYDNGLIYKNKYEALYCIGCEKFMSEKELDENGLCPYHKAKPVLQSEENYFFKLSQFQQPLLERITDPSHKEHLEICPEERKNEITGKLKLGLEDISVSRAALSWGIPLPFDKEQTIYVWVDALVNYITATGYPNTADALYKFWPSDIHLMAKDILWFHSVIWPAILMGCGLPTPKQIYSHGFFTIDGNKMSKSLGNAISPRYLADSFGIDPLRYLAVSLIPFGPDGDISYSALKAKYNEDLADNLGNLISRVIKMAAKYFDLIVPKASGEESSALFKSVKNVLENDFESEMDNFQLHKAAFALQKALTLINQQIENDAPWKLAKTDREYLAQKIFSYLQSIDLILIYLFPFMPSLSQKIWTICAAQGSVEENAKQYFKKGASLSIFSKAGAKLLDSGILFPKKV